MSVSAKTMRYAMGIEYDGASFSGWQQLGGGRLAVQSTVQTALSLVANAPIEVVCAGRTDAGVHAHCQVVHFDSDARRTLHNWVMGVTSAASPSIAVRWCKGVPDTFHARFSACARRYIYRLVNRPVRPALGREHVGWVRRSLDAQRMHCAAQALVGEFDFSAFRSSQCQASHARRCIQAISVERQGELIQIRVQANAFLHHMVRNIVGTLICIGLGQRPVEWIKTVLENRRRTEAGATAPPQGLVFIGPLYSAHVGLPAELTVASAASLAFDWPAGHSGLLADSLRPQAVMPFDMD